MAIKINPESKNEPEITFEEVPEVVEFEEPSEDQIPGLQKLGVPATVEQERALVLKTMSDEIVGNLVRAEVNSPEFRSGVNDLTTLAQDKMMEIGEGSSSLLKRSMKEMSSGKGTPQEKVSKTLMSLESTIEDINGTGNVMSKILRVLPGGKNVDSMVKRFQSAETTLNNIKDALAEGKLSLEGDNVELATQQESLRQNARELMEYIQLADEVKIKLEAEIARLKASSDPHDRERATEYETSLMFPIQQRRQDLRTQVAVAVQSFATMELVRQNNVELIKGVERTRATTLSALTTAVMVSNAQEQQRQVMESTAAVKKMTEKMMDDNSKSLQQNTMGIHASAVNATIDPAVLERSFQAIESTVKAVRDHQARAIEVQEKSIKNIDAALGTSQRAMRAIGGNTAVDNFAIEK